jgi:Cu+-exporting ATPase
MSRAKAQMWVLLGNDLLKFAETLNIARRTRHIIWHNLGGTIAVDAVGMALVADGVLNLLGAAFIQVASELSFILNSAPRPDRSRLELAHANRPPSQVANG